MSPARRIRKTAPHVGVAGPAHPAGAAGLVTRAADVATIVTQEAEAAGRHMGARIREALFGRPQ